MRAGLACLFVLSLAIYAAVWRDAPILEGDSPQYLEVARDLEDFTLDALHDRAPGYPMLLVLTRSSRTPGPPLFFVSLLLHFAAISLLASAMNAAGLPRRWIWVFCALLLLPPYVEPAGHVMTENLAQFALVATLACLVLWFARGAAWLLVLAAAAASCAALTRPTYQALAFVVAACLLPLPRMFRSSGFTRSEVLTAAAALCAGTLVVLGLLSLSNYRKFGYFGVVPTAGIHLSTKTMSLVERLPDEYAPVREILVRHRDAELTKRGGTHTGTQAIWAARGDITAATGLRNGELSRYLLRMNLALIRAAPMEYLQEVARSLAVYWFPPAGTLASMHSTVLQWLWAILHATIVAILALEIAVLTGLAAYQASAHFLRTAAGSVRVGTTPTRAQVIALVTAAAIVFYTMILSCFVDIGEVRQRRPTDALLLFMVFVGAWMWAQSLGVSPADGARLRERRNRAG